MLSRSDLDAVVFDFDGTLVDSRIDFRLMRERVLEHMRASGLDPTPVESRLVLEAVDWARQELGGDTPAAVRYAAQAEEVIWQVERPAVEAAAPFPGVPAALEAAAAAGLRLGVITRNSRRGVGAVLARHPLPVTVILTRDDLAEVKPHPRHLLLALEHLATAPPRSLMVGDHPTDIQCGRAAGARVAGVLTSGQTEERLRQEGAELVFPDVTCLLWRLLDGSRP